MARTLQHGRDFKSFPHVGNPLPMSSLTHSCLDRTALSAKLTGQATADHRAAVHTCGLLPSAPLLPTPHTPG